MGQKAQTIVEFTCGVVVLCLIIYGMVGVFRWGMVDLAERRYDHDVVLMNAGLSTEAQLNPGFHQPQPLDAIFQK